MNWTQKKRASFVGNLHGLLCVLPLLLLAQISAARTVCTIVYDLNTGFSVLKKGQCDIAVTPASTFKLPLAVMGFDSGFLTDAHTPRLSFQQGDPDWGGKNWTRDTTPTRWLEYSVVWYSTRLTHVLGAETFGRYVRDFGYGNTDITGDRGLNNGLDRAWLSSSLKISPRNQITFLTRLLNNDLPVSPAAMKLARSIVPSKTLGNWRIHGKTGAAYPRRADHSFDRANPWGWYVGWATSDDRTFVFARLTQGEQNGKSSAGVLTREQFLFDWPAIVAKIDR